LFPLSESAKRFRSAKVKVTQCMTLKLHLTTSFLSITVKLLFSLWTRWSLLANCPLVCLQYKSAFGLTETWTFDLWPQHAISSSLSPTAPQL